MKKIYVVAHTHWDFEWYFSRYEARVQFMYHMDEVFDALENNQLMYYALDGQMSIIDDYLETCPEKKQTLEKFVKAKRLFIGPWYTQIDEMVTSGEAIVHNLRQGIRKAENLGNVMRVGYLPDSFGQSQDMPKIYQGFDIPFALFWRGMPKELPERYFNWSSEDGSKVLVANFKNGYYVGAEWMAGNDVYDKLTSNTNIALNILPVGGDQRAIDRNLKDKIKEANQEGRAEYKESSYLQFFNDLEELEEDLPTYSGEFVEPTDSKIHRGIYSSRADLKQLYDSLERQMVYEVQPLMVIANRYGITPKEGACDYIWETIARGQAHDSSGGCNSDKTNQAIYQRGIDAKQMSQSLVDYLTRKLGEAVKDYDLTIWNTQLRVLKTVKEVEVSTKNNEFTLIDKNGQMVDYAILEQHQENTTAVRRDPKERPKDLYYVTKIAVPVEIKPMDFIGFKIDETGSSAVNAETGDKLIENEFYQVKFEDTKLNIFDKEQSKWYKNILEFEDGGDEGDNYDYSAPYEDWILRLGLEKAKVKVTNSSIQDTIVLEGEWEVPTNLAKRKIEEADSKLPYRIEISLKQGDKVIYWQVDIDNRYVFDHRLRMLVKTDVIANSSFADTPFGIIERAKDDRHLSDWQEIGYREEPTSIRPMINYANIHDDVNSWSILVNGTKAFQMINDNTLALTLYRGVGFLGRPDLKRRPGDASGLEARYVATPDSQLNKELTFSGGLLVQQTFEPSEIKQMHHQMQDAIYYHKQTINRFTTPLQFFQSLPISATVKNDSLVSLVDSKLVVSSVELTADQTGYIVRLYNPVKENLIETGSLKFNKPVSIQTVNLNDETIEFIADDSIEFELPTFAPGAIQTYAIYPKE